MSTEQVLKLREDEIEFQATKNEINRYKAFTKQQSSRFEK